MLIRVPTFKPGTYYVQDRSGRMRWVTYDLSDVKRCVATGNAQIRAGLSIPLSWMHDTAAEPQYLSLKTNPDRWLARDWFGEVVKWSFDPATQEAVAWCEVPDPQAAGQFKRVKKVSPGLKPDYVDQKGRVWPGMSVTHIASTPKPVQLGLSSVTDAAYQGQFLSTGVADDGVVWLSHDSNIRGAEMKEDMSTDTVESGVDAAANSAEIKELIELFEKLGVHIHGDHDTLQALVNSAKSAVATKLGGLPEDKEPEDMVGKVGMGGGGEADDHAAVGQNAMYMSLSPSQQATCIGQARMRHDQIAADIKALAANHQIDPTNYDRLMALHNSADLSVNVANHIGKGMTWIDPPYVAEIAAYQHLPKGMFSNDALAKGNERAADLSLKLNSKPVDKPTDLQPKKADEEFSEYTRYLMDRRGLTADEVRRARA